jgi:hypothetical protein
MTMRNTTEIFSIFGQIEDVAASLMIDRGLANRIDPDTIPETAKYHNGQVAKYAVAMSGRVVPAFEKLIRDLRA